MILRRPAIAIACFVGCAAASPNVEVTSAPPTAATASASATRPISSALRAMSIARELSIVRGVDEVIVSRDEMLVKMQAHITREVPHAEIDAEGEFLSLIGALAPGVDYEKATYAMLRGATRGMYEPFDQTMYLSREIDPAERDRTRSHESVHALQDQHFDLQAFERFVPGSSDTLLAHACLAEGDATSAGESGEIGGVEDVGYIERELAAPYVEGTAFVRALRARGGWAEVDRAWKRADLTTEQILHPEKWIASEAASDVPAPTFATLGNSFSVIATDVHGELAIRLVLESAVPHARAAEASRGWGGDRSVLVRSSTGAALAWRLRWDDDDSARRARAIITDAFACNEARSHPTSATFDRRDALILVGPAGSNCALLARWSKEVFSR